MYLCRHYGPMIFNFCWNKNLDEFLTHLIWSDKVDAAADAIKVYLKIHTNCKLSTLAVKVMSSEDLIRNFSKYESLKPGKLNAALDKLQEDRNNQDNLLSGHGAK